MKRCQLNCTAKPKTATLALLNTSAPIYIYICMIRYIHMHIAIHLNSIRSSTQQQKFYCQLSSSRVIQLKTGHDYYFQIQGTLAVTRRKWCDFVVWTLNSIAVQRVTADESFWEKHKTTLEHFYWNAILPELALPRHTIGQAIREPFLVSSETGSSSSTASSSTADTEPL